MDQHRDSYEWYAWSERSRRNHHRNCVGGRSRGIGNQVTKFFERYSLYCHPTPGAVLTVRLQVLLKLGLQPRADRRQLAVAACENNKSCKHRGGNACDLVMGARACWVIESDRCGSADRHSYDAMKDRRKASTNRHRCRWQHLCPNKGLRSMACATHPRRTPPCRPPSRSPRPSYPRPPPAKRSRHPCMKSE